MRSGTEQFHLAWELSLAGYAVAVPGDAKVFVDAASGEVLEEHSQICDAVNRRVYRFATEAAPNPAPQGWPFMLYREEAQQPQFSDTVAGQHWTELGVAYDYFNSVHGRDSYDNAGSRLQSTINLGGANAWWGTSDIGVANTLNFSRSGSHYGVTYGDFSVDRDIVLHELAHGVSKFTSQLIYVGESGALNEAFSDIMAAAHDWRRRGSPSHVPAETWRLGEATKEPSNSSVAFRYMNNPALDGASVDFYGSTFSPSTDVHHGSGIANLAFCLLTKGGQHPQGKSSINVPGIGMARAERIFYDAFTYYLNPGSQFVDARVATTLAANALAANYTIYVGTSTNAALAWDAVGVPFTAGNNHPINLSTRAHVGTGSNIVIAGMTLAGGTSAKPMLVRGVGPTLAQFGVTSVLSDPVVSIYSGQTILFQNDDWTVQSAGLPNKQQVAQATSQVGAFSLPDPSADAALLPTLGPGNYSIHLSGKSGGTGNAMVEIYDANTASALHLRGLSTRAVVSGSSSTMIAGFVINGSTHKRLLIRAVGPTLAGYGVSAPHPNPGLRLFSGSTQLLENDNWGNDPGIAGASQQAGLFPLSSGSTDAAMLVVLPPGTYSAHGYSSSGSGTVLLEVYEVDGNL